MAQNLRGLTFDDVLLVPGYNGIRSRQLVTTRVKLGDLTFETPLISSNMDTITDVDMVNFMTSVGGLGILHRFMSIDDNVKRLERIDDKTRCGFSVGLGHAGLERAEAMFAAGAQIVCVDVAHGHSKEVNRTIRALREKYHHNVLIIAGNVATYAGADYLAAAGADAIKVGIGCGSVCTTRIKTGYGVPQLSAIQDCSKVDRPLIADGGIKTPGDAVKALAAGADYIMLGGLLAGTAETPGRVIERTSDQGEVIRYKQFRGMASKEAQEDFMGQMSDWKTAEGVSIEVRYQGSAADVVRDVMGGIRSGLTYCGAATIKDLQRKAQFMEVSPTTLAENSPHAVGRLT